jgi:hypothetical protein
MNPKLTSRGGFFRPSRSSAPSLPARETSPNPKTAARPTSFLLRLKTIPTPYFQQLAPDFNRTMLRLRRMPIERKPKAYGSPDPQNSPGTPSVKTAYLNMCAPNIAKIAPKLMFGSGTI